MSSTLPRPRRARARSESVPPLLPRWSRSRSSPRISARSGCSGADTRLARSGRAQAGMPALPRPERDLAGFGDADGARDARAAEPAVTVGDLVQVLLVIVLGPVAGAG